MHTRAYYTLKNAKEPWQPDSARETVRGLQAGQSWQEPHLVRELHNQPAMADRSWPECCCKVGRIEETRLPSTILQPGDGRNGEVGVRETNVGKQTGDHAMHVFFKTLKLVGAK